MNILIVDNSKGYGQIIINILESAGYDSLFSADTAKEAFKLMGINAGGAGAGSMDLIIVADMLPDMDGTSVCRSIKEHQLLQDIPVIIITQNYNLDDMRSSITAGALYYNERPLKEKTLKAVEFLIHVQSALKIKLEIDKRKQREEELLLVTRQLEEANENLQKLSFLDGLTGIANRRRFDEMLLNEWQRAVRESLPISLVILDIDYFKNYNDSYGHLMGDECLKQVAQALAAKLKRPADLVSRIGGEEFAVILPNTSRKGAIAIADMLRGCIEELHIPHNSSSISSYVTVSAGVSSTIPVRYSHPDELVLCADDALYQAKHTGRNRVMY